VNRVMGGKNERNERNERREKERKSAPDRMHFIIVG
jgi:hypothetical protein